MKSEEIRRQIDELEDSLRKLNKEYKVALTEEYEIRVGDKIKHILFNDGYEYEDEDYMVISCRIDDKRVYGLLDLDILYVEEYFDDLNDIKKLIQENKDWFILEIGSKH